MERTHNEKIIEQIGFALFKYTIALFGFAFWFFLLSWLWTATAGAIVGGSTFVFLLVVMNIKRYPCPNANTQHAVKRADDRKSKERFTPLSERHYNEPPRRSSPYQKSEGGNLPNTGQSGSNF